MYACNNNEKETEFEGEWGEGTGLSTGYIYGVIISQLWFPFPELL